MKNSEIKLYIASSIDGFIAREDGSLDWLLNHHNPDNLDYGYKEFMTNIDTVVMGRITYEDVLGMESEWSYSNCKSYIVTNKVDYEVKTPNTYVLNKIDNSIIEDLKNNSQKNVWLIGGGQLNTEFLNLNAIDEIILFIIPIILGKGISLFCGNPKETNFVLTDSIKYNSGVVQLNYRKK